MKEKLFLYNLWLQKPKAMYSDNSKATILMHQKFEIIREDT